MGMSLAVSEHVQGLHRMQDVVPWPLFAWRLIGMDQIVGFGIGDGNLRWNYEGERSITGKSFASNTVIWYCKLTNPNNVAVLCMKLLYLLEQMELPD